MSPDVVGKLFGYLISLFGNIIILGDRIKKNYNWANQARSKVGSLGWPYSLIILGPIRILSILIVICLALSLTGLIAGAMAWSNLEPPVLMTRTLDNVLWIVVATLILAVFVYFNPISHFLLTITKFFDHLRFKAGWINSHWQLNHYKEFFALNIDQNSCERLANSIYRQLKMQQRTPLFEQLLVPQNISQDELANFLLFKCAIESCIHQLYPNDRRILSDSHLYLMRAAESQTRPFQPMSIIDHAKTRRSLYQTLRTLVNQNNLPSSQSPDSLPNDPLFDEAVQNVLTLLARKYKGKGSNLATDYFHPLGSPILLLSRLGKFDRFNRPEDEAIRRLFFKLSVRMKIWPDLNPGPFLYPFYSGIAILLLNSRCIMVPNDITTIDKDDGFINLVAGCEDLVIDICYRMVQESNEHEIETFCQQIFQLDPNKVDRWKFSDYIDLLLYSLTRQFCSLTNQVTSGQSLGCSLITIENGQCFCDERDIYWHMDGLTFIRSNKK